MPHADAGHAGPRDYLYFRHTLPVRLMHWTNVVALTILLMSGLQIFNAHPNLYWAGKSSYTGVPPVLEIAARQGGETGWVGTTRVSGHEFVTTGVLGVSNNADGQPAARAFPWWITCASAIQLARRRSATTCCRNSRISW